MGTEWALGAEGDKTLCSGAGKCGMPKAAACARGHCAVCCVLARGDGGCDRCAVEAAEARAELESELPGVWMEVEGPVHATADAARVARRDAAAARAGARSAWQLVSTHLNARFPARSTAGCASYS